VKFSPAAFLLRLLCTENFCLLLPFQLGISLLSFTLDYALSLPKTAEKLVFILAKEVSRMPLNWAQVGPSIWSDPTQHFLLCNLEAAEILYA